jgi:hypothetical protein
MSSFALSVNINGTDNTKRLESAPLLAMHAAARLKHEREPIPCEEIPALTKLAAEAGLEETKTILGWFFEFRCLLVSLPRNSWPGEKKWKG